MLKTPNEIKRGLETCARDEDCRGWPVLYRGLRRELHHALDAIPGSAKGG